MEKNKTKTPEEKEAALKEAINLLTNLSKRRVQGNVSFPLYDGDVGKAKLEIFVEPSRAKDIFKLGE